MSINSDIRELNSLLSKYGESKWHFNRVSCDRSARKVIQKYGGMGSINDLVICQANGHSIEKYDEAVVNEEFRDLLSSIHQQCVELISK